MNKWLMMNKIFSLNLKEEHGKAILELKMDEGTCKAEIFNRKNGTLDIDFYGDENCKKELSKIFKK